MAAITVSDLYINGVAMPDPAKEGVVITREKVWSSDTGRSASAKMLGTVVGVKTTIKITWPPLTPEQVALIDGAVSDGDEPFIPITYTDATGETVTKTVYFGTPSYTVYSWADGMQYIKSVSVSAIEQ
ncbi:MAG: hypothetical protein LUH36_00840 [Oscillospiraceae bacterium]|nr:hypothetical protein [Oscillospiraceae bacterium]